MRTLLIKRRGHRRKGYHRDGVYVKPTDVPGVIYRGRDRGRPGRGPKLITGLKKGRHDQSGYQARLHHRGPEHLRHPQGQDGRLRH